MSSRGLNLCTLAGYVAADPELRRVERRDGRLVQVAKLTIYVHRISSRKEDDSFTVEISIWEESAAWRKLAHIRKGSLIIATGSIDASPYISNSDAKARAGLQLKATDIFLDSKPKPAESTEPVAADLVAVGPSF